MSARILVIFFMLFPIACQTNKSPKQKPPRNAHGPNLDELNYQCNVNISPESFSDLKIGYNQHIESIKQRCTLCSEDHNFLITTLSALFKSLEKLSPSAQAAIDPLKYLKLYLLLTDHERREIEDVELTEVQTIFDCKN